MPDPAILRDVEFDWDPDKATSNLRKHGVSFDEAATVFADPLSITVPDPDHSQNEERFIIVGLSFSRRTRSRATTDFPVPGPPTIRC